MAEMGGISGAMNGTPALITERLPPALRSGGLKAEQARADAIISFAAKVKDWPLLADAVARKIEDQQEFVRWWRENVSIGWGGDRGKNAASAFLTKDDAETATGISQQQVSRWDKSLRDVPKYRGKMIEAACRKADLVAAENHRAEGTGDNQWFTPEEYIEAAREVMGGIDLDPASHPAAQQTVQADSYFTPEDDGLAQPWNGRIWLNPPYAQPLIGQFVDKLLEERVGGRVQQAIMLTHNYTDTSWFHRAEGLAALVCFTRGRIKFYDQDGDECSPTQGQAFFYYGDEGDVFRQVFSQFGFIR